MTQYPRKITWSLISLEFNILMNLDDLDLELLKGGYEFFLHSLKWFLEKIYFYLKIHH